MRTNPNETKSNLVISGVGSSAGGCFQVVRIDGMAKINGDVESADFIVNGKLSTKGTVNAEKMEVNGDSDFAGAVKAKQLKVNGRVITQGPLSAEKIRISGVLRVKGNCEADSLSGHGGFTVDGLLNAGSIDLTLYDQCKVKEIGCETIRIRRHGGGDLLRLLKSMFTSLTPKLIADLIEGDEIQLEHTEAAVVRGSNVILGAGCVIQKVEYKHSISLENGAKVVESIKL